MTKPLSERLEAAMHWYDNYGELPSDGEIDGFDLMREAAALARLVEGACSAYIFSNAAPEPHQVSGVTADDDAVIDLLDGKRVALVPLEVGA